MRIPTSFAAVACVVAVHAFAGGAAAQVPAASACIDPVPAGPAAPAAQAYLAAIDAWNKAIDSGDPHDLDAYFASFADVVDCFYGATARPLAAVRAARTRQARGGSLLRVVRLEVVRADAENVVLIDEGMDEPPVPFTPHRKIVALRLVGAVWKLVGETGAGSHGCLADGVAETATSRRVAACQAAEVADRAAWGRAFPGSACFHACEDALYRVGENAAQCVVAVPGGPVWSSIPSDGHLAHIEDIVWAALRFPDPNYEGPIPRSCTPYGPATVVYRDFDGDAANEAVVLAHEYVNVYRLTSGSLVLIDSLTDVGNGATITTAPGQVVVHDGPRTHSYTYQSGHFVEARP